MLALHRSGELPEVSQLRPRVIGPVRESGAVAVPLHALRTAATARSAHGRSTPDWLAINRIVVRLEFGRRGWVRSIAADVLMADDVEWDPHKAAANFKKHGIDFADAALRCANANS
ncbi:MAG TPA: BrnT family toxin, partial [Vicinamibacterales bacterium]|nr:BrnT family toxin [Vicinamibacterales bacterium]